jgi:deoxycytidine triphosphate deaminase
VLTICIGKIDVRALRHHRQRNAARARMGGHVTLEFSNTTPLPAKIYANEGVAQVSSSSPTRSAKRRTRTAAASTRAQQGVTLPKI